MCCWSLRGCVLLCAVVCCGSLWCSVDRCRSLLFVVDECFLFVAVCCLFLIGVVCHRPLLSGVVCCWFLFVIV